MKKYILTSPKFKGQITFGYDIDGHILYYNNECDNQAAIIWLKTYMPVNEMDLPKLRKQIEGTITEIPEDLSFDRFWNMYDHKVNRKRAEPLFEKLSEADKMLAIMRIKHYQNYCGVKSRPLADPDGYLSKRHFETNWNNLK
jgi:hypothetical protein